MRQVFIAVIIIACITGCTKDRLSNIQYFKDNANIPDTTYQVGEVIANEFVAAGSTLSNEYGVESDWIELYNTGDSAINFASRNYYVTDDSTEKDKFKIDALSIPSKGFLVIFCDDSTKITANQVHTGFSLKSAGEFIGVYRKDANDNFVALTERAFGTQTSNKSEGRYPDGSATWTTFDVPSPGTANQP